MPTEIGVTIGCEADIVTARQRGHALAKELGFGACDLTVIATAVSEIARNIVDHAVRGTIQFSPMMNGNRRGIRIVARDTGPGIPDLTKAMQYGYSTRKGLGIGLPGAKWLMDEFDIQTKVGKGTIVTMVKWLA